ncbi:ABC transporter ATP-binding protein [Clostridium sp. D43t1_170807_H7]|uniref:ABC transporter ATP-binding protein n=1 Tax=Clostridium sp. D43t1_170807_H7 TaxID=2787140 RepID=UPI001898DFF4|nr:ABC transporter ATP-binding protein [Clostridium sp. D43t1_170807_H7]
MKLEIKNLSKTYVKGKPKSLDNLSTEFTSGVYGILGPNGAGKSTLMNIIADNIKADSGEVLYNGENIIELGKDFRNILGYMPQQQGIYKSFTGRRFLWYMASLKGIPKKEAKERIENVLNLVNLKDHADKKLGAYSGGMKQRILIAQALLNDPEVLLLDEPTAGLDPMERIRIRNFISEIAINKIVIITTHIVSDIQYISKEILLMNKGKLLLKDNPDTIVESMQGKVFEARIQENQLNKVKEKYNISNIIKTNDGLLARIVSEDKPKELNINDVKSTLEDTYLYYFN